MAEILIYVLGRVGVVEANFEAPSSHLPLRHLSRNTAMY